MTTMTTLKTIDCLPSTNDILSVISSFYLTQKLIFFIWFLLKMQIRVYKKKYGEDTAFDGYITGLDWNLWNIAELNKEQTVRTLMYTLEKTMEGNRAPFTIGVHSQFYIEPKDVDFPNIRPYERREAFEEFIRQASRLQNVFFVSADMVIRWMLNPVSAAAFNPENYFRPN